MSLDLGPRTQEALHAELGRSEHARHLWGDELPNAEFWDRVDDEHGPMHFGFDGEPVSMRTWAVLMESPERLIAQEWVRTEQGTFWVSTVWMGIDHSFGGEPVIFETMIFKGEAGWRDVRYSVGEDVGQYRFARWEGAEAFHKDLILSMSTPPGIIPSYGG